MSFLCLVTIPADSTCIEAALAAIRAGGVGLLDLGHCQAESPVVQRNLAELARLGQDRWGVKASTKQLERLGELPRAIVVDPTGPPREGWLALVQEPSQLAELDGWSGVVVSGSENGGKVGSFSSLPLLDAALEWGKRPVYLHGAAGVRAAAGARAIGAAGVVLDDQILLMPESPLPNRWRRLLETPAGQETRLVDGQRFLAHPAWPRSLQTPVELSWGDPRQSVWPLGQGIALAPSLVRQYRTVEALVRAIMDPDRATATPLDEHSPLALSHGTRYPLVQGPMTRVSDRPAFARQVAEAGALPMMALALMSAEDTARLLQETSQALGELPWGVGILGFVPLPVRQAQLGEILKVRPRFALIAGGRPDQAHALEAEGIATYLHCPVPSLLRAFVAQGCRRFVFEGRECGGHTGPLGSLTLWEQMIQVLLEAPAPQEDYHLLFAGGLHGERTAALAATMAAPLTERGMRFGLLAGTAYLFTREAVATGAIVEEYQRQALSCRRTVSLESAPGQSNRVADTPFARAFEAERQRLRAEGASLEDTQRELEGLGLGRLRVAARGLERQGDRLEPVPPERQVELGMYLLGEVGALQDETRTLQELHRSLTEGSRAYLSPAPRPQAPPARPCQVAVVGISCWLPGATDPEELWELCTSARNVTGEVPADRWDWRLFFDTDRSAVGKTYSRWGGFFPELTFDPVEFGIPPTSMPNINPAQLLALEMARRALADAGLDSRPFDREATCAVVASSDTGGLLGNLLAVGTVLPLLTAQPDPAMLARMPMVNEETFTGTINNIVSGRVANRLDLGGPNYTVDAACASSLTALEAGVRELVNHRSNVALVGAVDIGMTPQAYQSFGKLTALSPTGRSRPFDTQADGIVLSEGSVFVVLKRLEDAQRDGDRIYAVIQSVGASSDGKALGMTAPLPAGQLRALNRAYHQAGVSPAQLGLYEAHGTGTPVGDRAEAETVTRLLSQDGAAPRSVRLGSVKALMGHTKVAAGLVSLAKVALALHHQTLPPHPVEQPLEALQDPTSPLALDGRPAPWLGSEPLRAGVSSFGFGGTNAHAVLEQYRGPRPAPGGEAWPWELLVFTGSDLLDQVRKLATGLGRGARPRLRDIAYTLALKADPEAERTLVVVIDRLSTLEPVLRLIERHLVAGEDLPPEAMLFEGKPGGRIAFLFSGQGSQAVGACREPALYLSELRQALELAQREVGEHYPRPLASYLYPGQPLDREEESAQRRALTDTHVAQPVLGALSLGLYAFLERLGVRPDALAGHSFGELTALAVAGVVTEEDFLRLAEVRGRSMAGCAEGTMAAVLAPREEVERHLVEGVVVANHNAPEQTVISGSVAAVETAVTRLREAGHTATRLEVAGAFHSPLMQSAQQPLADFIATLELGAPSLPVLANKDGQAYPQDPEALRSHLQSHLLERVEFVAQIRALVARGVDTFVEVGPGSVLSRLVEKIAPEATAIALGESDLRSFLTRLARLSGRVSLDWPALFQGRSVQALDLAGLEGPPPLSPTAWLVNGNQVRRPGDPLQKYAQQPLLDSASAAQEARRPASVAPAPAPTAPAPTAAPAEMGDRLAAFQAYQETMRVFLKSQEEVMRALMGSAPPARPAPSPLIPLSRAGVAPAAPAPPPPMPKNDRPAPKVEAPEPTALTEESLLSRLVALVSERTGYPPAMLGADLDIEAQLGVDSIKRLEILDRFVTTLSDPRALHGQLDRLSRTKTLRGLAQAVLQLVQPAATPCARYVMQPVETPRPAFHELPRGLCWITEDARGAAEALVSRLAEKAVSCLVLPSDLLADPARLEARVEDLVQEHGPCAMLVHLAPVGRAHDPQVEMRSLFQIVRKVEGVKRILVATCQDGHFGRKSPGSPYGPACQALLKCLQAEWPGLWARALDFEAELSSDSLAEQVAEELASDAGELEVGLPRSGRLAFKPVQAPAPAGQSELPDGAVVLATGGARGISFHCLSGLVRAGMRLVLLGTTPLTGEEIPALPPEKLRAWLLERSQGETPAAVEARLQSLLRQREIREHLEALTRRGLTVDYRVCDVRDRQAFSELIASVYQKYGRLDSVLHGAGIIRDKLVGDKTMESFDEVVATKVAAAEVLLESLKGESLRSVVLFSSTAGRFGNRGQGDYALANEVLNRLAYLMQARWPRARVVSVAWGPWAGAGMAGEEVNRAFRSRGIEPITTEAGVAFLQAELRSARGEVEVVAGEGPWDRPLSAERAVAGAAS
ncbi:MAG: hypothetical protein AMXMBFR33_50470 [Candidatus Xenobia bacterium]